MSRTVVTPIRLSSCLSLGSQYRDRDVARSLGRSVYTADVSNGAHPAGLTMTSADCQRPTYPTIGRIMSLGFVFQLTYPAFLSLPFSLLCIGCVFIRRVDAPVTSSLTQNEMRSVGQRVTTDGFTTGCVARACCKSARRWLVDS